MSEQKQPEQPKYRSRRTMQLQATRQMKLGNRQHPQDFGTRAPSSFIANHRS